MSTLAQEVTNNFPTLQPEATVEKHEPQSAASKTPAPVAEAIPHEVTQTSQMNEIKEEVIKKLSSIKDEIEARSKSFFVAIDYNEIQTPPQFKNHISLRGVLETSLDLSSLFSKESVPEQGSFIGIWEGKWGMNDAAFTAPNGILSPFSYSVTSGINLLEGAEPSPVIESASLIVSGSFKVRAATKVATDDPYVEVKESNLVLKLDKLKGSETTKASITGSGENQYGLFKLFGELDLKTKSFSCYREYLKQGLRPKVRKNKRKTSTPVSSQTKKPRTGSLPPMKGVSLEMGKRERKLPAHLKDSLNLKTFKPEGEGKIGSSISDMQAIKDIVQKLLKSDKEGFFSHPVDPIKLQAPDYFDIIKHPMDLGTVASNLQSKVYQDFDEAADDVTQVFKNAMLYNPHKHAVHKMAARHLKHFEKDVKNYRKQKEKEEKAKAKKLAAKQRARDRARGQKFGFDKVNDFNEMFAKKKKEFSKTKKQLMGMFSSSEDDDSDDSDDNEPLLQPKKKRKRSKNAEYELMKKTMAMMSSQMEMMQQMQNSSLEEITSLKRELTESRLAAGSIAPQGHLPQPAAPGVFPGAAPQGYGFTAPVSTSKPKQKREVKPLSYQQMKQLGHDINRLPTEDIAGMISLLQELGADLGDTEEFELDIEKLSPEIQRQIQKYVSKKLARAKSSAAISELRFDDS